jgi:ferredoxin--NADP+ reductase
VPFDERTGTIHNRDGRVVDRATGHPIAGEYVVGWAKRGPTGVIGTNKPDAADTVERLLADVTTLAPAPQPEPTAIEALLQARAIPYVTVEGWRVLDQIETMRGSDSGRPRVKFTDVDEMLQAIRESHANLHGVNEEASQVNVPG